MSISPLEAAYEKHKAGQSEGTVPEPENQAAGQDPEPTKESEPEREIPRDKMFEQDTNSLESFMQGRYTGPEDVPVTEDDKALYLKAMLNDKPVHMEITLFGGQLSVKVKARSTKEQQVMYLAIHKDRDEGLIPDTASLISASQRYGIRFMLVEYNNSPVDQLDLEGLSYSESVDMLREETCKLLDGMSVPKWNSILNAMNIFEAKMAKMGTECLNENFWTPAG
jgi:hypothetical protein